MRVHAHATSLTADGHPNIPVSRVSNRFIGRQVATSWNIVRIEAERVSGVYVYARNYIIFFSNFFLSSFLGNVMRDDDWIRFEMMLRYLVSFFFLFCQSINYYISEILLYDVWLRRIFIDSSSNLRL